MGHVSDFSGMNDCTETDLNQAPSDLISVSIFSSLYIVILLKMCLYKTVVFLINHFQCS